MVKCNFKRHYLNGVHCGQDVKNTQFNMPSWEQACMWAHEVSTDPELPDVVFELENCDTGEHLDLTRYDQRTKNEIPVRKKTSLLAMPDDPFILLPPIPQRRKEDGNNDKQKHGKR